VLVATQVVEVSLDVDFDQAFIEPAPIDALVQRMGRVNRAGTRKPASVVVFMEQVNRHRLYCECSESSHEATCRVRRSIEVLQSIQNPISEKDLVDAANHVYADGYRGEDKQAFNEGFNHPDIIDFEGRLLAGAHQDWVEQVIESTDGTVEMIPACLVDEYKARRQKGLWIEANALLVSIRVKSLGTLKANLNTASDPWVLNRPYSSAKGLEL
jgi:CRISPR-associated endonuclease/helicase Cas3